MLVTPRLVMMQHAHHPLSAGVALAGWDLLMLPRIGREVPMAGTTLRGRSSMALTWAFQNIAGYLPTQTHFSEPQEHVRGREGGFRGP
jgi:hypothetical protein